VAENDLISQVIDASPSRRKLIKRLGLASAAATAMFAVGDTKLSAQSSTPSAVDILNFALNLEYLEAEFYTYATTGKGIDAPPYSIAVTGTGNAGVTSGGSMVNFSNNLVFTGQIAAEIAADERAHVILLRGALGNAAVARPEINLNALNIGFANEYSFLQLARIFEDIGVSAYGYAAGVSTLANSPYIGTAARILATEAEHVGNIRLQVGRLAIHTSALDTVDILPPPSGSMYISADNTGLTAVRSPGQVLFLAYGGLGNATAGGFFPTGVNGTINTSSATAA
jgi:hypothetical protein